MCVRKESRAMLIFFCGLRREVKSWDFKKNGFKALRLRNEKDEFVTN
jgi:hypothetical protein